MMLSGKNHQAAVEIKISGQDFPQAGRIFMVLMKFEDASPANTGFVQ